ncbi:hypothetical protein R2657_08880, partial [Streptococcus pyogenes]|uniref:hypothetical protein n=1 Tax=Streptococcus pyogenes TaxID=1314 RepID=UPI003204E4FC
LHLQRSAKEQPLRLSRSDKEGYVLFCFVLFCFVLFCFVLFTVFVSSSSLIRLNVGSPNNEITL